MDSLLLLALFAVLHAALLAHHHPHDPACAAELARAVLHAAWQLRAAWNARPRSGRQNA